MEIIDLHGQKEGGPGPEREGAGRMAAVVVLSAR
jgi:hypothetical protein